jgi:hypothetical protein
MLNEGDVAVYMFPTSNCCFLNPLQDLIFCKKIILILAVYKTHAQKY